MIDENDYELDERIAILLEENHGMTEKQAYAQAMREIRARREQDGNRKTKKV